MTVPALGAGTQLLHRQALRGGHAGRVLNRQNRPADPVRAPFVVDDRLRTEFAQTDESRPAQERLPLPLLPAPRDVRHQRQTREVVARQESF